MKGWGASAAAAEAEVRKTGSGAEGRELLRAHSWVTFVGFIPRSTTTTCHLPNASWNLSCCAGIKSQTRRVCFSRIWSPSVMWLCLGPCGSCRTWPSMPAPYSRSWKTTSRPPTSGSGGCRAKSTNFSRLAPSWTPNRRQCVSNVTLTLSYPFYVVSCLRATLREGKKSHEEACFFFRFFTTD